MHDDEPRITLTLPPGLYLVSAHPVRTRVWATNGVTVEGHGVKLRRTALSKIFNELHRASDDYETKDDREVVRAWERVHSSGWKSVVEERRSGRFWGGAMALTGETGGGGTSARSYYGTMGDYATFEEAKADGEGRMKHIGHRCDARCSEWIQTFSAPSEA